MYGEKAEEAQVIVLLYERSVCDMVGAEDGP
jgi:hypothetical protein